MKNINQFLAAAAVAALFVTGCTLPSQDWPQWRGANRDGKSSAFAAPDTWPTNLTQQWKIQVGKGDASPALVGANLYVFARQETNEVLFCLDAATGKAKWQSAYPANYVVTGPPSRHPGPRSSPVVAGGKVCTLGVGGILSCFNAATGAVLWRKQSTNDYLGIPYQTDTSMSPIVADGLCVAQVGKATNGAVIAFDLGSGKPKWKWAGDGPANSSPMTMTVAGKKQLVIVTAKFLVGLDPADGKLLWQVPFATNLMGNNLTPIIAGDTVIFAGPAKGMSAVKIEALGGAWAATPLWSATNLATHFTTPVLKDGLLYSFSERLFCADAQNGAILWDKAVNLGQYASLVDAGKVMLALGTKGELLVFEPGKTYTPLARYTVGDSDTWTHPVVAGNRIYIKDSQTVGLWIVNQRPAGGG